MITTRIDCTALLKTVSRPVALYRLCYACNKFGLNMNRNVVSRLVSYRVSHLSCPTAKGINLNTVLRS